MAALADDEKAQDGFRVLILGGCGFIGRHLVQNLVVRKKCLSIVVADKLIPLTSYFTNEMIELYKNPKIKRIQCDLSRIQQMKRIFPEIKEDNTSNEDKKDESKNNDNNKPKDDPKIYKYNYIINLCGETRFGQSDNDYKVKCLDTAINVGKEAKIKCKTLIRWIEISTGQIYEPKKSPAIKENGKIAPFTRLANARYKVEQELKKLNLPLVILRPSIVYGPGDRSGLTPRLVTAACYKHTQEKMTFLWTEATRINCVHVRDVANAISTICTNVNSFKINSIYNLSDYTSSLTNNKIENKIKNMIATEGLTQGILNPILESIFEIKCDFQSAMMNKLAKQVMKQTADYSNNKHMPMWSSIKTQYNLKDTTPLSPFIDEEILTKNHLSIDGTKIEKETPFKYKYPILNENYLIEIIDEFTKQGYFPDLKQMTANNNNGKK